MKKIFLILLTLLIVGCVTQPEIRYYQSYNRSSEFELYIQGDGYKLWYDKELDAQFIKVVKDSTDWKAFQKSMSSFYLI